LNEYLLALILGVIEGLTEFLPVSSTAHLRIGEALLGISLTSGYWKMFTIVIQLGAILCLPIYFRSRIAKFWSTFPRGERGDRNLLTHPVGLTIIAFLFTAVPALLMTKIIGKHLESLIVMGCSLVIGGIVMWIVDNAYGALDNRGADFLAFNKPTARVEDMTLPQAVWIGICQITSAVFPGTSRSMSTIAGGQLAGMNRPAALEFSFFLSLPTMVAATLYDLWKSLRHHAGETGSLGIAPTNTHEWIVLGIGFVVSFIVAYAVVAWFMNWVRTRGFVPFAVYRLIVGAAVLAWAIKG
jgi:undecaprenyl-diphosphatase